ncbi:Ileal sodium/bile acid cotransporter, partial [Dissostichus eleginoides]
TEVIKVLCFPKQKRWEALHLLSHILKRETVAKKPGMKGKSKRALVMSCVRRKETASPDRRPPRTDTLYMCHSRGPVTLRQQSREDEIRRRNSGEESNKGATPDNAVSVFITTH